MAIKWSDVDAGQQEYYLAVFDSIDVDDRDGLKERIMLAKSFGLDLADNDVMQILRGVKVDSAALTTSSVTSFDHKEIAPVVKALESQQSNDLVNVLLDSGAFDQLLTQDLQKPAYSTPLATLNHQADCNETAMVQAAPNKVDRIYGENWVVLQNRLLNAISNLDLNERRFILFISSIIRKAVDANPNERTFVVRVADFADAYNLRVDGYYSEFERIVISLQTKYYMFWDWDNNSVVKDSVRITWITKGRYKKKLGEIHFDLHEDVVEMLSVFDKSNPFTKYQRDLIVNLGSHGIILFELISSCMYQRNKAKIYTINYLREKFNCVESYLNAYDFKRYVIDKAIKEIETFTPYRITYKQNLSGKIVQSYTFRFSNTEEAGGEDIGLPFYSMSKSQIEKFSNLLSRHPPVSKFAIGESNRSFAAFANQIAKELQDADAQPKYHRYLEEIGFKPSEAGNDG